MFTCMSVSAHFILLALSSAIWWLMHFLRPFPFTLHGRNSRRRMNWPRSITTQFDWSPMILHELPLVQVFYLRMLKSTTPRRASKLVVSRPSCFIIIHCRLATHLKLRYFLECNNIRLVMVFPLHLYRFDGQFRYMELSLGS